MKKTVSRKKTAPKRKRIANPKWPPTQASAPSNHSSPVPIRHILVPIDFSDYSKNALRYAVSMAEQYSASIHLIYVIEPMIYPADLGFGQVVMPGVEEELRMKSENELQGLLEREVGSHVHGDAIVRLGRPHQEILTEAEEKNIDLIILATHGHSGVEQILFGSTAMRVVRLARCPVLIMRPKAE